MTGLSIHLRIVPEWMQRSVVACLCASFALCLVTAPVAAQERQPSSAKEQEGNAFAIFAPKQDRIDNTIDYGIWDYALKQLVVDMGPALRERPVVTALSMSASGSRIRAGHNSRYRVEGTMLGFQLLDRQAIASFTEYREDLERVANEIDIARLARNEQLAFWFNLHNVALVEQMAQNWPFRQTRRLEIDGVPVDEARIVTIRGVAMSLRDIREKIVYANWRDPRVIYGFWRGEIGSPSLRRQAFTALNVETMLTEEAQYFVNSLRGTEKRGDTLHVSTLYEEVAPFYFPEFERDLRRHIGEFAEAQVSEFLEETDGVKAVIREWDIADLAGGYRDNIALKGARPGLSAGAAELLTQRQIKQQRIERRSGKGQRTGTVTFTPLYLPGDDPAASQIE
jgi:hypothetical protein